MPKANGSICVVSGGVTVGAYCELGPACTSSNTNSTNALGKSPVLAEHSFLTQLTLGSVSVRATTRVHSCWVLLDSHEGGIGWNMELQRGECWRQVQDPHGRDQQDSEMQSRGRAELSEGVSQRGGLQVCREGLQCSPRSGGRGEGDNTQTEDRGNALKTS